MRWKLFAIRLCLYISLIASGFFFRHDIAHVLKKFGYFEDFYVANKGTDEEVILADDQPLSHPPIIQPLSSINLLHVPKKKFKSENLQIRTNGYRLNKYVEDSIFVGVYKINFIFTTIFGIDGSELPMVELIILKSWDDYIAYAQAHAKFSKKDSIKTSGYFNPEDNTIVTTIGMGEETMLKTVFHEVIHYYIHNHSQRIPVWLDEGLATSLENITTGDLILNIKDNPFNFYMVKSSNISLDEMIGQPRNFIKKHNGQSFAIMYANFDYFTRFLLEHTDGRQLISRFLDLHNRYYFQTNTTEHIVKKYYPGGMTQLEESWLIWKQENIRK